MSQESVATGRLIIEIFNRGDTAAWLEQYDADVAFHVGAVVVAVIRALEMGSDANPSAQRNWV